MPETIEQLRAENAKLRAENQRLGGATTMMGCKACGHGVRPRYAVHGMCADCAAKRITELETVADAAKAWNVERELAGVVCGKMRTDEDVEACKRQLIVLTEAERALSAVVFRQMLEARYGNQT